MLGKFGKFLLQEAHNEDYYVNFTIMETFSLDVIYYATFCATRSSHDREEDVV